MANNPLNTEFLDKAIRFAVDAHAGTERRGKGVPYIVHPMEAMEIVATMTSDQTLLAAAVLHDTIEDTDVTSDKLKELFGDRVAALVEQESDIVIEGMSEESSWRSRKKAAINRLAAAPLEAKMVALGDKLSNMRAIDRDYAKKGDELWKIFHAPGGKPDHEWHYRSLAESLSPLAGTPAFSEFLNRINNVFGDPKPELINIDDYTEFGGGFNAVSFYSNDGKRVMKLYSESVGAKVPVRELKCSWSLLDMGIHVPYAYRIVTDGKRYGIEFQRIKDKKSFSRAIADDPSQLEHYARIMAVETRKIHGTKCRTGIFKNVKDRFLENVIRCSKLSEKSRRRIIDFIIGTPDSDTCLHGDINPGNLITSSDGLYWIDLGDFAYGNHLFDLGQFFFLMRVAKQEIVHELFHLNGKQLDRVWKVFCENYFGKPYNEEEIAGLLRPYACLYMITYINNGVMEDKMLGYIENTFA